MVNFKRYLRFPSILILTGATFACGSESEPPEISSDIYPYVMADGATACSDGRNLGRNIEYYFFDKINEELQTSSEYAIWAKNAGIRSVDSCESARRLNAVIEENIQLQLAQNAEKPELADGAPLPGSASDDSPTLPEAADVETERNVDKIKDGFTPASGNFAVQVNNGCSGVLIGAHWLLTAAHCFSSNLDQPVTIRGRGGAVLASATMIVRRHPGFTGLPTEWDDLAVVRSPVAWAAPGNTSSEWRRIFGRPVGTGGVVNLWGYGVSTAAGTGAGVLRRTNQNLTINSSNAGTIGFLVSDGPGRACAGDSGGPAISVGAPSFDYIVGLSRSRTSEGQCPAAGEWHHYTQAGGGAAKVCTTGGTGSDSSCFIQDTINQIDFNRCARFSHAASGTTAAFTYLRCW